MHPQPQYASESASKSGRALTLLAAFLLFRPASAGGGPAAAEWTTSTRTRSPSVRQYSNFTGASRRERRSSRVWGGAAMLG
jgi:hypothetical protein